MPLLQEIKVPLISVNDTTLTVVEVTYENGGKVDKGDVIIILETSKTTYDVIAEATGYIEYICKAGNDYEVNDIIAIIYSEATEVQAQKSQLNGEVIHESIKTAPQHLAWQGEPIFSREAIALIEKHGLNKLSFSHLDFVSKLDVEAQYGLCSGKIELLPLKKQVQQKNKIPEATGKFTLQKLSSNKKREIQYLSAVQSAGLISTINVEVETDGIFFMLNKSLKFLKNSLLPVILYESGRLLKQFPLLNAFYNEDSIAVYDQVNIGFAVDAGKGLKVLKINDTNTKNINDIEDEIMNLSELYLEDKLSIENLNDITFTVTDLSSEDVSFFQPLINMHNSAILGVSAIDAKYNRCTLSLTFDHRVTEGKSVAIFLKQLKERLTSYNTSSSNYNLAISCFRCFKTLKEDLSGIGFVKCITIKGEEGYLCQSCFKGF